MTNTKHTPGPWIAAKGAGWLVTRPNAQERREAAIAVGMTPAVTIVGTPYNWFDEEESEANARLIAAAPELLEALKALVNNCADYEPWQRPCLTFDNARAAIAKAEGGAL